jgi:predicted nucleic acid-binding protein
MTPVFADTSFYFAALNPGDVWHGAAIKVSRDLLRTVVTSEFVLLELGNALSRTSGRRLFVDLVNELRADPEVVIVPASEALWAAGFDLYRRRPDKDWSMIDCTSFVVMGDRALADALTSDRHFEQAGFHMLLK